MTSVYGYLNRDGKLVCDAFVSRRDALPGTIIIPEGVTAIGDRAFSRCSSVTSITLPESVTAIGNLAFVRCSSITSIILPQGVTVIGDLAFSGCSSATSITLSEGVTAIGHDAFKGCGSVESITIICDGATNTTTTPIMKDGRWLVRNPFVQQLCAAGIECDTFPVPLEWTFAELQDMGYVGGEGKLINEAFLGVKGNAFIEAIHIPPGVTAIGAHAFRGCCSATTLTIPGGVMCIGAYAFHGCTSITDITIPEGVTSIGDAAFFRCESATSITILDGVTAVGKDAFAYCSKVTSITIPEGLIMFSTQVGCDAFKECVAACKNVTSMTVSGKQIMQDNKWTTAHHPILEQLEKAGLTHLLSRDHIAPFFTEKF